MRWLTYLNLALVCFIGLAAGMLFFAFSEDTPHLSPDLPVNQSLPKSSFAHPGVIGEGATALKWVPPVMQLPDLRNEVIFYGKNERPDIPVGKSIFQIGFHGSKEHYSFREREPIYLTYLRNDSSYFPESHEVIQSAHRPLWGDISSSKRGSYAFSSNNQPTALWLEVRSLPNQTMETKVGMFDEQGIPVTSPPDLKTFFLSAHPLSKSQVTGWKLDGYRVDTSLLIRQKARWIGSDRFLEWHGGDEFSFIAGCERIDFLERDTPYSCFVRENDFLVWKGGHWQAPQLGESTLELPLMVVKKIDEKVMSLELWHPGGKGSIALNLIRTKDRDGMPNLSQEFKFIGAKTWTQFIVECQNGVRITLKTNDWLLFTHEGWKKLKSVEEIDDYIEQCLVGPLFILDKLTKHNGQQVLVGHLFNTSRTQVEQVALSETSLANFYHDDPFNLKNINIKGSKE